MSNMKFSKCFLEDLRFSSSDISSIDFDGSSIGVELAHTDYARGKYPKTKAYDKYGLSFCFCRIVGVDLSSAKVQGSSPLREIPAVPLRKIDIKQMIRSSEVQGLKL